MLTGWWHQATDRSDEPLCTGNASYVPAPMCCDLVVTAGRSDPPLRIVCVVSARSPEACGDAVLSRLHLIATEAYIPEYASQAMDNLTAQRFRCGDPNESRCLGRSSTLAECWL